MTESSIVEPDNVKLHQTVKNNHFVLAGYQRQRITEPCILKIRLVNMQERGNVALNLTETHKTVKNIKARGAFTVSIAEGGKCHSGRKRPGW